MPEISSSSLSELWASAVERAWRSPRHEVSPLIVVLQDLQGRDPAEDSTLHRALNDALERSGRPSIETTANTIFPYSLWNPRAPRHHLFTRYRKILPVLRHYRQNRRGLYFERFINYPGKRGQTGMNQLDHVIDTFRKGNHRRSALQVGVLSPQDDLNDARQQVFPCLQQVAFAPDASRGTLAVTGFYPMQYLFSRAYGNYLGLARLGRFMAHEMRLMLIRVVCISLVAKLDVSPAHVRPILARFLPLAARASTAGELAK